MRRLVLAALSSALLFVICASANAETRFFVSGGPTGTSDYGFKGGWGGTLGLERQFAPAGAFLVRLDGGAMPTQPYIYFAPASFGEGGAGSKNATLLALMAGLRLKGWGKLGPYLDALVGVGYVNNPVSEGRVAYPTLFAPVPERSRSHTNVAFSLGPGIEIRPARAVALFADVHYDFYSEGTDSPLVPVRLGVIVP